MTELVENISQIGAGVVALGLIFYGIWHYMKSVNPTLKKQNELLTALNRTNEEHTKIIENNTQAIKEMSCSNDNVANALSILDVTFKGYLRTMESQNELLNRHDQRAENIENRAIEIQQQVKNIQRERGLYHGDQRSN